MTDARITSYEFDVEVDKKANEKLAEMGINKPEDLGPGRLDLGQTAQQLGAVDAEVSPLLAEKVVRDQEMRRMAEGEEQPTVNPPAETQQPTTVDERLAAAEAEVQNWKTKFGERENQISANVNKLGEERKAIAERLARLEQGVGGGQQTAPQQTYQQPATPQPAQILGNRDPNEPITGAEVMNLMLAQSQAFGQQISAREQAALERMQEMTTSAQGFDLTPNEEADLLSNHTWLARLERPQQMTAMRDLIKPARDAKSTSGPAPVPARTQELQRQHIAHTTFIEPSAQGSDQEQQVLSGADPELVKKAAKLRELLNTSGGSTSGEAEKLMNELSRGRR